MPPEPKEPRTEAGKTLLALMNERGKRSATGWDAVWAEQDAWGRAADELEDVLPAIEEQAATDARRELLAKVRALPRFGIDIENIERPLQPNARGLVLRFDDLRRLIDGEPR